MYMYIAAKAYVLLMLIYEPSRRILALKKNGIVALRAALSPSCNGWTENPAVILETNFGDTQIKLFDANASIRR